MKTLLKAAAFPALGLALAGCQVNVDNQTRADASNTADRVGAELGNAADAAGNLAERGAAKVENAADAVGNMDVDVNLHGSAGGNSADGNRH